MLEHNSVGENFIAALPENDHICLILAKPGRNPRFFLYHEFFIYHQNFWHKQEAAD